MIFKKLTLTNTTKFPSQLFLCKLNKQINKYNQISKIITLSKIKSNNQNYMFHIDLSKISFINNQFGMTEAQKVQHFRYPECGKGGDHVGQVLNLVCLQPKCIQNSIICGICYDESHRNHKIKPLKIVINQSKKYLQQLTPMNIDSTKIKASIQITKTKLVQKFDVFEKQVQQSLSNIKKSINAVFIKIIDQIELKTGSNDELLMALEEIKVKQMQYERFIHLMKKLLAGVPLDNDNENQNQNRDISGQDIEKAVGSIQKKVEIDLEKKSKKVQEELQAYVKVLQKIADNPSIFGSKTQFKFSNQFKHSGINVVSDKIIKSSQAYNYHFGLLEPSLQQKGGKGCTVAFRINQNSSNWLAVGVCYKNTVQANNYQFNYSALGHGAYLMSCNSGSWSSIDAAKNNVVNAFSYYKDDIILVTYDPDQSRIIFKKKGTEQSHTLQYEASQGDELYLCGLFYYNNDEIEFLGYADDLDE